jgi:hypothetical protein
MTHVTAELIDTCRSHFCAGLDIHTVAAAVGLDFDTVRRIHDVHRWQTGESPAVGRLMGIDPAAGRITERAARLSRALSFLEAGCSVERAAKRSGVTVAEVTRAINTMREMRELILAGVAFHNVSRRCGVALHIVVEEAKRLTAARKSKRFRRPA